MAEQEKARLMRIPEAAKYLRNRYSYNITTETLRKWAERYKFGHQLGDGRSHWVIDQDKLDTFMQGQEGGNG